MVTTSDRPTMIMVGVDGSWKQTGAVEWALAEALRTGAPLRVLYVVDDSYGQIPQLAAETVGTHAQDLVDEVRDHLHEHAVPGRVTGDALAGKPGVALAKASEWARMLVVGRRGAGTLERLLIGSTAESVVSHATVPVVVVPDEWKPEEHRGAPVVAGIDPWAPSDAALDFAVTAAAENGVPLHLLGAWEVPTGFGWELGLSQDVIDSWEHDSRQQFDELASVLRDKHPEIDVRATFAQGHPVAVLLDEATSSRAQLLVVGGRAHGRLAGFLLGSVARGVLAHAGCPVAVVHEPAAHR